MGYQVLVATFRIQVESWGASVVARDIRATGRAALDQSGTFHEIADYMMRVEREQFDSEGGLSGGWEPLDVLTIQRKRQEGKDPRILHATHRLRESLTERGHPDMILDIDAHSVLFGSSVPYGGIHAAGAEDIPERPPIVFSRGRKGWLTRMLRRGLVQGGGRLL